MNFKVKSHVSWFYRMLVMYCDTHLLYRGLFFGACVCVCVLGRVSAGWVGLVGEVFHRCFFFFFFFFFHKCAVLTSSPPPFLELPALPPFLLAARM